MFDLAFCSLYVTCSIFHVQLYNTCAINAWFPCCSLCCVVSHTLLVVDNGELVEHTCDRQGQEFHWLMLQVVIWPRVNLPLILGALVWSLWSLWRLCFLMVVILVGWIFTDCVSYAAHCWVFVLSGDDMKVMENDTDWQFVTIGDQVSLSTTCISLSFKTYSQTAAITTSIDYRPFCHNYYCYLTHSLLM